VRDQIDLTIDSYRNLYESSIAFGIRKAVHAEKQKGEMKKRIQGTPSSPRPRRQLQLAAEGSRRPPQQDRVDQEEPGGNQSGTQARSP
jgi:hypothetical protein